MKIKLLFLLLCLSGLNLAQETVNLNVSGVVTNDDLNKKEAGVTVTVFQGSKQIASAVSASNGKFSFDAPVPANSTFDIVFSKSGFVSKRIKHNISGVNLEDLPSGNVFPIDANAGIFTVKENLDFSFLNTEPVASFSYDSKKNVYAYDQSQASAMRTKIENMLAKAETKAKEDEIKYQAAIKEAEAKYASKDYVAALKKYEEALSYKPKEKLPSDRILELDALIQAEKKDELLSQQADSEYNNLIKAGDNLRDQKKYSEAISKYNEAITKKSEQYPKDQVASLTKLMEDEKKKLENKKAYDEAITSADMFFKQKSYKAAKDQYLAAQKLIPSEKYPGDQLLKIDKLLQDQEAIDSKKKKYEEAVAAGDALYDQEKWEEAKVKYTEALAFESASTYLTGRIKIIDDKLAELKKAKENEEKLAKLLQQGDQNFKADKLAEASANYKEVLTIEAENQIAKTRLEEINQKLEDEKANAAKNAEFAKLVAAGDAADKIANLDLAKTNYDEALALKPDAEVQKKLDAVNKKISDKLNAAEIKKQYDLLITEGAALLKNNELENAKGKYQEAATLDPSQKLPKDKIAEIDALIDKNKLAEEKNASYKKLVDEGEAALLSKDYITAKSKYTEAQKIDATQTLPPQKIKEIDKLIADDKALADKEKKYQDLINQGTDLISQSKLAEAKIKFQEAQKIDASQTLPAEKIKEIDDLIAKNNADKANQEKIEKYNLTISTAEKLSTEKNYQEAIKKYQEAKTIDNTQSIPDSRIAELNKLIDEQADMAAKEAKIKNLLLEGQKSIDKKDYPNAKLLYEEVISLDNQNTIAPGKLSEVNNLMASQKSAAEKDALFASLKKEGFDLAAQNNYSDAKLKLNEALSIKTDPEITLKIKAIDDAMAKLNSQNELDKKYTDAMNNGVAYENDGKLNEALTAYKLASSLKASEKAPKDKIDEITKKINGNASQAKIDADYNALMSKAEKFAADKDYLKAIAEYNNALALKPTEQKPVIEAKKLSDLLEKENDSYLQDQYEKILSVANTKIDEKDFAKATELIGRAEKINPSDSRLADMKARIKSAQDQQAAFDATMKEASSLAASSKFEEAIGKYEYAKTLNSTSSEPQKKIDELKSKLANQNSLAEKESEYQQNMSSGASELTGKNYQAALNFYKNALNIKKADKPASDKIAEISQILDQLANASIKDAAKQKEINALIAKADKLFDQKQWMEAKNAYENVLAKDGSNAYALGRRDAAQAKLDEEKNAEVEKEYQKIIAAADKAFTAVDYEKAKSYYLRALSFRNTDPYPKAKLAEIDAILNPVMAEEVTLKPLGIPVDNSVLEGSFLQQAENNRINAEQSAITDTYQAIKDKDSESSNKKYENSKNASLEINATLEEIRVDTELDGLDQQANLEYLRSKELERKLMNDANENYENAQINNTNDKLVATNLDLDVKSKKDAQKYLSSSDSLRIENNLLSDAKKAKEASTYQNVFVTKEELTNEMRKVEDNSNDQESRVEAKDRIDEKEEYARIESENSNSELYERTQKNLIAFDENEQMIAEKNKYGYDNPLELNTILSDVEKDKAASDKLTSDLKTLAIQDANSKFVEIDNQENQENLNYLEKRANNEETFNESEKSIDQLNMSNYNKDMEKNYAAANTLESKQREVADGNQYASTKTYDARDQIALINEKERISQEELNNKSDADIAKTNELIVATKEKQSSNTDDQLARQTDARNKLLESEKQIQERNANMSESKKQDQIANQEELNNKQSVSPATTKSKLKNSLGEDYPQGVSQEVFQQNDENGLMKAIITRRIVVVGDHGDIFVRTQTTQATTYSKNGMPITEYQWVKGTQDASLVRNY